MVLHLARCELVPPAVKQRFSAPLPNHVQPQTSATSAPNVTTQNGATYDQDKFEMTLAIMFYVCSLPFVLVESPAFRAVFLMLNTSVKFPSRHKLADPLPECARDEYREIVL